MRMVTAYLPGPGSSFEVCGTMTSWAAADEFHVGKRYPLPPLNLTPVWTSLPTVPWWRLPLASNAVVVVELSFMFQSPTVVAADADSADVTDMMPSPTASPTETSTRRPRPPIAPTPSPGAGPLLTSGSTTPAGRQTSRSVTVPRHPSPDRRASGRGEAPGRGVRPPRAAAPEDGGAPTARCVRRQYGPARRWVRCRRWPAGPAR